MFENCFMTHIYIYIYIYIYHKAKSIATYDFNTLCVTFPHDKLIKRLCNVIDFVFEGGKRTHICISKNNVAYWEKNLKTM